MNVYTKIEKTLNNKDKFEFVRWYSETDSKDLDKYSKDSGIKLDVLKTFITDEQIQWAIKMLLSAKHTEKMINIYDKFYEQAISGDVQSARFLIDFSKQLFEENKEDELSSLLNNIKLGD